MEKNVLDTFLFQFHCIRSSFAHTQTHLCEHGLSILGDHGALITVEGDKVIVEGLLGMLQHIVELSSTTLKYTPEVPRD